MAVIKQVGVKKIYIDPIKEIETLKRQAIANLEQLKKK